MTEIQQGEILFLEKNSQHVLVLSREFFNRSGMAVVCPLLNQVSGDALHIDIFTETYTGTAMLEQLRSLDLQARFFRRISRISYEQIQNISDAVQGIFDYHPYSI